jgi:hypothetical protein
LKQLQLQNSYNYKTATKQQLQPNLRYRHPFATDARFRHPFAICEKLVPNKKLQIIRSTCDE